MSPLQEHVSVVQSIPRLNRTSTSTKKPNVVYATSTEASTKSSVVQSIPRARKTTTSTSTTTSTTTTSTTEAPKTVFGHYLKGTLKSRPRFIINGQQRPIAMDDTAIIDDEDSQINRPSTDDKNNAYRRIVFAKRPIEHSLPVISDDFVEKEDEAKITTGNNLRRQLHDDANKPTSGVETGDDHHSDVYGGSLSTTRPLFTTTVPSRVLQRVSSTTARTDRPKIYLNRDSLGASRLDGPKYEGTRIYETETKPSQEERVSSQQLLLRPTTARIPVDDRDYTRPTTESVYLRQQADQYLRELPPRILVQSQPGNLDEEGVYRAIPIGRILFRPPPSQPPIFPTASTTDANVHYLTENPGVADPEDEARFAMNANYVRARPVMRPLIYSEAEQRGRPILRPMQNPIARPEGRDYQSTTPEYPYRAPAGLTLPPEPPNPISAPLSRRDFQTLLRRLLVSQYGVQALSYPKSYLEDALYDQQPYSSYPVSYQAPIPRPSELAFDQQAQYGERVALRRPLYPRALNPLYHQYDDYHDGGYAKRVYRQKFYPQDIIDESNEILPAPIREALLLRMVNLAINAERSTVMPTTMATSTTTPASRYRKIGPIRSVQIITDDDENKDARKKM